MSGGDHPVAEVMQFIRETDRRGMCFGGWPDSILEIYLSWHHQNGSLVLVEHEKELVALAVGTQMPETSVDQHWVQWDSSGDSVYLSDLLASKKQAVGACFDELANRCKGWRGKKLIALRHGKKRRFKPAFVEKWLEEQL